VFVFGDWLGQDFLPLFLFLHFCLLTTLLRASSVEEEEQDEGSRERTSRRGGRSRASDEKA
jgi:hypothetical protein